MSENEETRSEFHQLMDEVRSDLVRMGGVVTEGIASVTVALLANDLAMADQISTCLLYTSPSPRDATLSRMPSSA